MAGMLDNPDAAYAKLREMGKGLFGPDGAGLGNILSSFGLGGAAAPGGGNAAGNANPQTQQRRGRTICSAARSARRSAI